MKVRIGIGTGGSKMTHADLLACGEAIVSTGFDSIWLPEVLTSQGIDPLVGLAAASQMCPTLKLGTTLIFPGRHTMRLAKMLADLDQLSNGRLLVTAVSGLAIGKENGAIGAEVKDRGVLIENMVSSMRELWGQSPPDLCDEEVCAGFARPHQNPLEVWFGGSAQVSQKRCGRIADGWLPAMIDPTEAKVGLDVVNESAAQSGRTIDPEHFGVSIGYATEPLPDHVRAALEQRTKGRPLHGIVPESPGELVDLLGRYLDAGFSKFVLRPLQTPMNWADELSELYSHVGHLQS